VPDDESKVMEMGCSQINQLFMKNIGTGGPRGGMIYPLTWEKAAAFRAENSAWLSQWIRVEPARQEEVDVFWREQFSGRGKVLGIHLRGTDKMGAKVEPEAYAAMAAAYIAHNKLDGAETHIFLATDDHAYAMRAIKQYEAITVQQPDVLRGGNGGDLKGNAHQDQVRVVAQQ
jgi:hypothetical protein